MRDGRGDDARDRDRLVVSTVLLDRDAHRIGDLAIGDIAVVVAAAAPHRDAAFAAARSAIDELKSIVPIWKKEHAEDGAIWIEEHA